MTTYNLKYLKYKLKYLQLKQQLGGVECILDSSYTTKSTTINRKIMNMKTELATNKTNLESKKRELLTEQEKCNQYRADKNKTESTYYMSSTTKTAALATIQAQITTSEKSITQIQADINEINNNIKTLNKTIESKKLKLQQSPLIDLLNNYNYCRLFSDIDVPIINFTINRNTTDCRDTIFTQKTPVFAEGIIKDHRYVIIIDADNGDVFPYYSTSNLPPPRIFMTTELNDSGATGVPRVDSNKNMLITTRPTPAIGSTGKNNCYESFKYGQNTLTEYGTIGTFLNDIIKKYGNVKLADTAKTKTLPKVLKVKFDYGGLPISASTVKKNNYSDVMSALTTELNAVTTLKIKSIEIVDPKTRIDTL